MADNTVLNPGVGGDTLRTEDVGGGVKIPVSKIHNGASDVDGGAITQANPFNVILTSGSDTVGTITNPLWGTGSFGVLIGGQPASLANRVPVTGSVGALIGGNPITFANPTPVSGAVGIQIGGVAATLANPVPVTGSTGMLIGGVQASLTNPVPVAMNLEGGGQVLSGSTARTVQYTFGDFGTSGSANQVIAPQGANNRIRVLSAHLMTPTNLAMRWQSTGSAGTITNLSGLMFLPANGGFVLPHNPHGWFQTVANEGLNLNLNAAVSVGLVLTWMIAGP